MQGRGSPARRAPQTDTRGIVTDMRAGEPLRAYKSCPYYR